MVERLSGMAWHGTALRCKFWRGKAGCGVAWPGKDTNGIARKAGASPARWFGVAIRSGSGKAGHGEAGCCLARRGDVWQGKRGMQIFICVPSAFLLMSPNLTTLEFVIYEISS